MDEENERDRFEKKDFTEPTPILNTQLSVNIYDVIYEHHPFHAEQKIHVLVPFIEVNIHNHLFVLLEVLEAFNAVGKDNPQKDEKKNKSVIRPVFIASDNQGNDSLAPDTN